MDGDSDIDVDGIRFWLLSSRDVSKSEHGKRLRESMYYSEVKKTNAKDELLFFRMSRAAAINANRIRIDRQSGTRTLKFA